MRVHIANIYAIIVGISSLNAPFQFYISRGFALEK